MRFTPPTANTMSDRFAPNSRPPRDLLPAELGALLTERDRLAAAVKAARDLARDLASPARDLVAKDADEAAAATAARAGQPGPKPVATGRLAGDRAQAARTLAANEAAVVAVTKDIRACISALQADAVAEAAATRASARERIAALADRLASEVEAAVAAGATADWLKGSIYYPHATTWPVDILPILASRGIDRRNMPPIRIREIIMNAALTVLEEN